MKKTWWVLLLVVIAAVATSVFIYAKNKPKEKLPAKVDFNNHIRPILSDRCFKCHGPDEKQRKGEKSLKAYIYEAIEVERAGLKVKLKKTSEYKIPEEFQKRLNKSPALKTAFDALTPGRQRAYIFHFSQPKLSKTRDARVEKYMKQILNGKGLNDQ